MTMADEEMLKLLFTKCNENDLIRNFKREQEETLGPSEVDPLCRVNGPI